MNWRTKPLLRPLLFLIIGIVIGTYFPILSPFVFVAIMLPLVVVFVYIQNEVLPMSTQKYIGAFISFSFLLLGAGLSSFSQPSHNDYHIVHQNTERLTALAEIDTPPSIKNKISTQLRLISKIEEGKHTKLEGNLMAYFPISERNKNLKVGDVILIHAKTYPIQSNMNPFAFDFKNYYANQGIYHQSTILEWSLIKEGKGVFQYIQTQRKELLNILSVHLPTTNEYAVGAALCLGAKDFLSKELKNEYADTGAMHVLAISGLHVGIVFSFVFFFFSSLKTRKTHWIIIKIMFTIFLLWVYALFTGGSPSVLRASLMFSFITVAMYLRHNFNTYNTLAAAAICLLLYDPNLLYNVGFQLSFTAVAGIVYFQPKIYALLYFPWKVPDYFWQISSVGIAAQLATFPIGLYYFHHLPIYFLLTGLFVIPFAYMILLVSIILFITQAFSTSIAVWIGKVLYVLIWANNALIHLISSFPGNSMGYLFIGIFVMILLYTFVYFVDLYTKKGTAFSLYTSLGVLLCISIVFTQKNILNSDKGYLCVYHTKKNSLIDIGYDAELLRWKDELLDPLHEEYASFNLRKFHGVQEDGKKQSSLIKHKDFILVADKKICIFNDNKLPSKKISVNYLILNEDTNLDIGQIQKAYEFDVLIFDNNLSKEKLTSWKRSCEANSITYHDVNKEGAFYEVFD